MDTGRGAGVTGVVDILVNNSTVQFGALVLIWKEDTKISSADATGQGSGGLSSSQSLLEKGSVILQCKFRRDIIPFPQALKNSQGVVTFTLSKAIPGSGQADIKMSATYRFTDVAVEYDEKDKEMWAGTIIGDRVDALTTSGWANNATQSSLASNGTGNSYLYAGRQKFYDPYALRDTSDQAFLVWGMAADTDAQEVTSIAAILTAYSTPPQTLEKQHHAVGMRLSDTVMRITVHWSPRDIKDDTLFPHQVSTRSVINPFIDRDPQIFTSAATVANLANQVFKNFQSVAYAKAITVTPLTPGKKLVTFEYQNIGYLVRGKTRSGARQVEAKIVSNKPQLYVLQAFAYSAARTLLILQRQYDYTANIRDFTIFRQILGTTIPENSGSSINGITLPDIGTINASSFLGLAAKTVLYQGVNFKVNLGLTANGALSMLIGYAFHSSSLGIVQGVPTGIFNRRLSKQINPAAFTTAGWYDADSLGFPDISQPPTGDFSAFNSLP